MLNVPDHITYVQWARATQKGKTKPKGEKDNHTKQNKTTTTKLIYPLYTTFN